MIHHFPNGVKGIFIFMKLSLAKRDLLWYNKNHENRNPYLTEKERPFMSNLDNPSYERFKSDPTNKEIICTPNYEPSNGKFFMYVLANYNGKKLFVLECRENLLMNIMKFAKRSVLENDYVMQERKQKKWFI